MRDLTTLRASALPMAFACPASVRKAEIQINESNDAANAGTATHEVLQALPQTGKIDWEGIPEIAKRYGADPDETRMLSAMGFKLWKQVNESFAHAMTEVSLELEILPGVILTGHTDALAVSQTSIRVGDWKSGRKDSDYSQQLKAYAAMALLSTEDMQEATGTALWIRDQEIENYTLSRADALAWKQSLIDRVINWDGIYRPGKHCAFCPRSHECEAVNAMVRRDIAAFTDKSLVARLECELETMPHSDVVSAYQKASLIVRYAERVREAVKAHIEKHGDIVADGVRISVDESTTRELDPLKSWPILEGLGFGDEDLARAIKLRISELEEIIRERTPRGKKGEAVKNFAQLLETSGAVIKSTKRVLSERRCNEKEASK
jgi:hypothetical protein